MDLASLLGFSAGTLTTLSLLPQIIKIWKSKSAQDISKVTVIVLCSGILLWIFYGIFINSLPVILTNAVTFVMASIILALKIKYG